MVKGRGVRAVRDAINALAEETSKVLSAMLGEHCEVMISVRVDGHGGTGLCCDSWESAKQIAFMSLLAIQSGADSKVPMKDRTYVNLSIADMKAALDSLAEKLAQESN